MASEDEELGVEIVQERSSWTKMAIKDGRDNLVSNSSDTNTKIAAFASTASWAVNWFLLIAKIICVIISSSKAVAASLADSAVDLVSQGVLSLAEIYIARHSPDYPVGRSRLEALSVLACASIMIMASIEIIQFSIIDLINAANGIFPTINVDVLLISLLSVGIGLKLALYIFCSWARRVLSSDSLEALAEDHLNDVLSNAVAIITASIAARVENLWWFDPVGAILISIVIIYRWMGIMYEQVKKIVGHTAPPEFIQQVQLMAYEHDGRLSVDCVRAYHFGSRCKSILSLCHSLMAGQTTWRWRSCSRAA
jgi:cation diffusion facilitator family transporter